MTPRLSNVIFTALATFGAAAVGISCDKSSSSTTPPPSGDGGAADSGGDDAGAAADSGGDATEPGAPDVKWADKTFKQKQEYMGIVVLPAMKTMFKEYDEAQYKDFKCQTCHGDDMNEVKFAMPTDSIYPLPEKDPVKAAMDYDEKVTKFMIDKVVPETAKLLDMEPYSPENPTGFGCFGCHPKE